MDAVDVHKPTDPELLEVITQIGQFEGFTELKACTNWHEKALQQKQQLQMLHLAIGRRNRRLQLARERYETLRGAAKELLETADCDSYEAQNARFVLRDVLDPPRKVKPTDETD